MNFEEVQSEFQLRNCKIEKLKLNNDFIALPSPEELKLSISIKNAISNIEEKNDNFLFANLKLDLEVMSEADVNDQNIYIRILLNGIFTFNGNDKERFTEMLLLNGNATLYSIARSHIITLSALSCVSGQITLPMINFVKLLEMSKTENQENME